MNELIRSVRKLTNRLRGRINGMITRGTMGTLNSTARAQLLQVGTKKDDVDDDVEYFEAYGFTSAPVAGSEGLVLRLGGQRASSVAILFGNRLVRIAGVAPGEVAVYDDQGASIILRQSGNIEVTPGPAGTVQLGGPTAVLAVARETDPVIPNAEMTAFMASVVAALGTLAGDPVITVVPAVPVPPAGAMGTIASGGVGSTST